MTATPIRAIYFSTLGEISSQVLPPSLVRKSALLCTQPKGVARPASSAAGLPAIVPHLPLAPARPKYVGHSIPNPLQSSHTSIPLIGHTPPAVSYSRKLPLTSYFWVVVGDNLTLLQSELHRHSELARHEFSQCLLSVQVACEIP
jgi:hypothetical protein